MMPMLVGRLMHATAEYPETGQTHAHHDLMNTTLKNSQHKLLGHETMPLKFQLSILECFG
jgi:hypothetical protein